MDGSIREGLVVNPEFWTLESNNGLTSDFI